MPQAYLLYFGSMIFSCSRSAGIAVKMLLLICLAGCKTVPHNAAVSGPEQQIVQADGDRYTADTAQSYIRWTGSRPGKKHDGTLHLQSGSLTVHNGQVNGGRFEIAVASLTPQDQRKKGNELLRKHLLGEDFFEAGTYPVILFEIASVVRRENTAMYAVTGNLVLRNVIKSISFPAGIAIKDGTLTADAAFSFDRTDWGLNYGNDKSLGNWFISPVVTIKLHLSAQKL